MPEREPRHAADVERVYSNDQIEVTWDPAYCTHFGACVGGAPHVFNPHRRPWIDLTGDQSARILAVVDHCPTGALRARPLGAGVQVDTSGVTNAYVQQDGPIFVRGLIRILDQEGGLIREATRLALCRCGASQNKPFCDDSHYRIGFKG